MESEGGRSINKKIVELKPPTATSEQFLKKMLINLKIEKTRIPILVL